jgi:hypothetical protein
MPYAPCPMPYAIGAESSQQDPDSQASRRRVNVPHMPGHVRHTIRHTLFLLALAIISITVAALAAAQSPPPSRPRQDCSAAVYREFDFWVGSWTVTAQGQPAGTNRIEAGLNGCVLVEHWTAVSGGRGTSLNFYDRVSKAWYQSWMDQSGGALRLTGGLSNGRMVLQSDPQPGSDGRSAIQRVTWTPEADGTVRQLWESTSDGGKTWTTVFDGRYTRAK